MKPESANILPNPSDEKQECSFQVSAAIYAIGGTPC
jgi:hypothetical protein